jgi:HSP20 family molecular chaperone IbpA
MNTQPNWNSWQEMRRLQQTMEHLFSDFSPAGRWSLTGEYPPENLTREDKAITLEALCPGVERGSLDISVAARAGAHRIPITT